MDQKPDPIIALLPALRRYALALTRQESEAEDLVQEALLRGHENRRSFRLGGNLRAWLMSILHNAFVDRQRQQAASSRRDATLSLLQPLSADPPQEMQLRLSQLRRAFLDLPEDQREAILLVGIEGLTYAEAAEIAGVPLGTLISRVSRGRAALRAFEEGPPQPQRAPYPVSGLKVVGGQEDA